MDIYRAGEKRSRQFGALSRTMLVNGDEIGHVVQFKTSGER